MNEENSIELNETLKMNREKNKDIIVMSEGNDDDIDSNIIASKDLRPYSSISSYFDDGFQHCLIIKDNTTPTALSSSSSIAATSTPPAATIEYNKSLTTPAVHIASEEEEEDDNDDREYNQNGFDQSDFNKINMIGPDGGILHNSPLRIGLPTSERKASLDSASMINDIQALQKQDELSIQQSSSLSQQLQQQSQMQTLQQLHNSHSKDISDVDILDNSDERSDNGDDIDYTLAFSENTVLDNRNSNNSMDMSSSNVINEQQLLQQPLSLMSDIQPNQVDNQQDLQTSFNPSLFHSLSNDDSPSISNNSSQDINTTSEKDNVNINNNKINRHSIIENIGNTKLFIDNGSPVSSTNILPTPRDEDTSSQQYKTATITGGSPRRLLWLGAGEHHNPTNTSSTSNGNNNNNNIINKKKNSTNIPIVSGIPAVSGTNPSTPGVDLVESIPSLLLTQQQQGLSNSHINSLSQGIMSEIGFDMVDHHHLLSPTNAYAKIGDGLENSKLNGRRFSEIDSKMNPTIRNGIEFVDQLMNDDEKNISFLGQRSDSLNGLMVSHIPSTPFSTDSSANYIRGSSLSSSDDNQRPKIGNGYQAIIPEYSPNPPSDEYLQEEEEFNTPWTMSDTDEESIPLHLSVDEICAFSNAMMTKYLDGISFRSMRRKVPELSKRTTAELIEFYYVFWKLSPNYLLRRKKKARLREAISDDEANQSKVSLETSQSPTKEARSASASGQKSPGSEQIQQGFDLCDVLDYGHGILEPGKNVLNISFKGHLFSSDLRADGKIIFQDQVYDSPSEWSLVIKQQLQQGLLFILFSILTFLLINKHYL